MYAENSLKRPQNYMVQCTCKIFSRKVSRIRRVVISSLLFSSFFSLDLRVVDCHFTFLSILFNHSSFHKRFNCLLKLSTETTFITSTRRFNAAFAFYNIDKHFSLSSVARFSQFTTMKNL